MLAINIALAVLLFASLLAVAHVFAGMYKGRPLLPRGEIPGAPWSAADAGLVFGMFFIVTILAPAAAFALAGVFHHAPESEPSLILMIIFTYLFNIPTFLVMFAYAARDGRPLAALGFASLPLSRAVKLGLLLYVVFLPFQFAFPALVNTLWERFFTTPPEQQKIVELFEHAGVPLSVAMLIAGVVIAPVVEELVFRGFVQRGIENSFGKPLAVLITSLLFATIHGAPTVAISILPLAFLLSLVYMRTRSIFVNIVLHAAFNASSFIILIIARLSGVELPGSM